MPSARRGSNFSCRAPLLKREREHLGAELHSVAPVLLLLQSPTSCVAIFSHLVLRQEIGSVLNLPTHDRMFAASLHAQPHFQPVIYHFHLLLNCLDSSLCRSVCATVSHCRVFHDRLTVPPRLDLLLNSFQRKFSVAPTISTPWPAAWKLGGTRTAWPSTLRTAGRTAACIQVDDLLQRVHLLLRQHHYILVRLRLQVRHHRL